MNTLIILLLVVVVLVTTPVQVECKNETCTERYTIIPGPTPRDGRDGIQGVPGQTGDKGDRGDIGPTGLKGDPGSTIITEEELNHVSDNVTAKINESIIAELLDIIQTLNQTLTDRLLYLESQVQPTNASLNFVISPVLTGEGLPTLTPHREIPVQLVFVQSPTLQPIRQHVEGLLTLVVPHFNSHLMATTLMFVVE